MILKQRLVIIFDLLAIATLSYPFIFTSYKYKNLFKENLSYLKKLVLAMNTVSSLAMNTANSQGISLSKLLD